MGLRTGTMGHYATLLSRAWGLHRDIAKRMAMGINRHCLGEAPAGHISVEYDESALSSPRGHFWKFPLPATDKFQKAATGGISCSAARLGRLRAARPAR